MGKVLGFGWVDNDGDGFFGVVVVGRFIGI